MKSLNSNNSGKIILVEICRKIEVTTFIKEYKEALRKLILKTGIEFGGQDIKIEVSNVGNKGYKYFFACPICGRKVGAIYSHPVNNAIGCRLCLRLEYRSRRYKGMIECEVI